MGRNVYINLRTKLNLGIILCSLIHTQKILLRFFRSIFRQKSIPLYTTLVHIDIVSRIGSADENKRKTGNEEMARMYITYYVTESVRFVCAFHGSKKNAFDVANLYVNYANAFAHEINERIVCVGVNSFNGESVREEYKMYL